MNTFRNDETKKANFILNYGFPGVLESIWDHEIQTADELSIAVSNLCYMLLSEGITDDILIRDIAFFIERDSAIDWQEVLDHNYS